MADNINVKGHVVHRPMFHTGDKIVINNTELTIRHLEWWADGMEWYYYAALQGDIGRLPEVDLLRALERNEIPSGWFLD